VQEVLQKTDDVGCREEGVGSKVSFQFVADVQEANLKAILTSL
jgi:hypothetical protein